MPKPTKTALGKHPLAVVLLSQQVSAPGSIDFDFEWFETDKGQSEFLTEVKEFAQKDVEEEGDVVHAILKVTDAKAEPITVASVDVFGRDTEFAAKWRDALVADPTEAVAPSPQRAPAKVKPKIKAKRPSTAAAVLKPATEQEGGTAMAAKAGKSAELKAKLAARKATPEKTEAEAEAVEVKETVNA